MSPSRIRRASQLLSGITALNFLLFWLLLASIPKWASEAPRDSWTHPVRFRGNHVHYVPELVGVYVDLGLWVHFALLALGIGVGRALNRATAHPHPDPLPKGEGDS
jgi:hypothetical protein